MPTKQWRHNNPERAKESTKKYTSIYRDRIKVSGYLVIVGTNFLEDLYNTDELKFKSEYVILKQFRKSYAHFIERGHKYTVLRIKKSRFDKVPNKPTI